MLDSTAGAELDLRENTISCWTPSDVFKLCLQMVLETKAGLESGIIGAGHRFAASRLDAQRTTAGWVSEQMGGLSYLNFIRQLLPRVESEWDAVKVRLSYLTLCSLCGEASTCTEEISAPAIAPICLCQPLGSQSFVYSRDISLMVLLEATPPARPFVLLLPRFLLFISKFSSCVPSSISQAALQDRASS